MPAPRMAWQVYVDVCVLFTSADLLKMYCYHYYYYYFITIIIIKLQLLLLL